jgi:hypothetical protein
VAAVHEIDGAFAGLDHHFVVAVDDTRLASWLTEVLAPLRADVDPVGCYRLTATSPAPVLTFDDEVLAEGPVSLLVGMLLWHVNRQTVERSRRWLRLHAAVAAREGVAVVLPAEMESGKTTLVTGLVRAGLDYLSDEVCAVDPATLRIDAYPKALSIDPGSWEVLAPVDPHVPDDLAHAMPDQWIVPATAIRDGAIVPTARPGLLVGPRYVAGARTRLEPVRRADAVLHCATSTFEFTDQPDRDLAVLGELAEASHCYRLVVGDLDAAVDLVLGALDRLERGEEAEAAEPGAVWPVRGAPEHAGVPAEAVEPGPPGAAAAPSTDLPPAAAEAPPPRPIDGASAPRRRDDVLQVTVDAESVLYNPTDTRLLRLNEMGTLLWRWFDGTSTIDEIAEDLDEAARAAGADAHEAVLGFAAELEGLGVLA